MLGTETVILLTESRLDADNNPVTSPEVTVPNCLVEDATVREDAGRPDERRGQGSPSIGMIRVLLPITSGVHAGCALKVRGRRYQVIGDPQPYIDPDGDPDLSGYDLLAEAGRG